MPFAQPTGENPAFFDRFTATRGRSRPFQLLIILLFGGALLLAIVTALMQLQVGEQQKQDQEQQQAYKSHQAVAR